MFVFPFCFVLGLFFVFLTVLLQPLYKTQPQNYDHVKPEVLQHNSTLEWCWLMLLNAWKVTEVWPETCKTSMLMLKSACELLMTKKMHLLKMQFQEDYSLYVNKKKKKMMRQNSVMVALPFHAPCSSSSVLSSSLKSLPGWGRQSPPRFQVTLKPSDTHTNTWMWKKVFTFLPFLMSWSGQMLTTATLKWRLPVGRGTCQY